MKKRIFTMLLVVAMLLGVFGQSPANAYDIIIGSSVYDGAVWHYDLSVGLANPGTGAGLTALCSGLLPIEDIEVLPDGNIIVGAKVFGGAAWHYDMPTMLANPGQVPLDFADPNIIGSGQTMLCSNFGLGMTDPNVSYIDDIEILPGGNVVVGAKIWGGGLYHFDMAKVLVGPYPSGLTMIGTNFGLGAEQWQPYFDDIEVLPDGNLVFAGKIWGGCLHHGDVAKALVFDPTWLRQLGENYGLGAEPNLYYIDDVEVLPDTNVVFAAGIWGGSLHHCDMAEALADPCLGTGITMIGMNFGLEADANLPPISEIAVMDDGNILIDGSIFNGSLWHYDIAEALADPCLGTGQTLIRAELGSVYDIEMLPDANAFLGSSSLGGRLHYLDIASDPNINNATLSDFIGGLGEIYDVKSLPDGNVLIAASNVGGAIYHLDLTDISAGIPVVLLQAGLGAIYEVEVLPTTGQTCVDKPDADLDDDCDVDLEDFAVFASEWLDCGTDSGVCP